VSVLRAHPPKKVYIVLYRIPSHGLELRTKKYFLLKLDRVYEGMCRWCKVAETQVQDGSMKYEAKLDEGGK